MRQVRCGTAGCEWDGVVRDVPDIRIARGVVTRPDLYCEGCGSQLAVTGKKRARRAPERAVTIPPETR